MSISRRSIKNNAIKIFAAFLGVVASLLLIALVRTLNLQDSQLQMELSDTGNFVLQDNQVQRFLGIFSEALQFQTISLVPDQLGWKQLQKFKTFLRKSYPSTFASPYTEVETINNYSLLLYVQGTDLDSKPYMLAAHLDVVPVDPAQWSLDPFLGKVVNNPISGEEVIWGRGAIDFKVGVVGILSALESLFQNGWQPKRSFYIGFGHDEEIGGKEGAGQIGKILQERRVSLDFLVDEGGPVLQGIFKGVEAPTSFVGVAEKGRLAVEISVEAVGGHSSIPPSEQAAGILARALQRIYDNPQPSMFGLGPEVDMFRNLAPKAVWPYKFLYANTWLFSPILAYAMSQSRVPRAFIQTTTAITMVNSGIKDNVVPSTAHATIDHRVHPGQSIEDVLAHDIASVDDTQVKFKILRRYEPHPISPYGSDCLPYQLIVGALKHVFPEAVPIPVLHVGNTDTKHYLNLTSAIYRLYPLALSQDDLSSIHGKNEKLSVKNFRAAILFYVRLIVLAENSRILSKRYSANGEDEC